MVDELLLRPGVAVSSALEGFRDLIRRAGNVASGGGGLGRYLTDHLIWVEDAELHLRNLFRSPEVWQELYTDRYWQLRPLADGRDIRSVPLIRNESTWQRDRLQAIFEQLDRTRELLDITDDTLVVITDTNVFMHFEFYDDIDWPKELDAKSVRLVVPQLVIEELDNLSFRSNPQSDRARKVIRSLQQVRGTAPLTSAIPVRNKVDLQFFADPPGHSRRPSNDDEILARAEYLAAFVGQERILVVASDYGMLLQAASRELPCTQLRDGLRVPRKAPTSSP